MRLFTSSSKVPTKAHMAVLLGLCLGFCALVEEITIHFFPLISEMEKRHEAEYSSIFSIQSGRAQDKTSVLIAGNSLLLHAVEFAQLQREVGSNIELHRAAIENTFYLDWYYGLHSLLTSGAHPDVVVLVLNPAQITSDAINGDYSVHMMVDGRDLSRLAKDIGADRNRMSVLVLDKVSFFFGVRAQIRSWILGRMLPDLPVLTHRFHFTSATPDSSRMGDRAVARLLRLTELCHHYGVQLQVVIPPATEDSGASAILHAAASEGIPVLMPIAPGVLPLADYSDGFHLNSSGALRFTSVLAASLKQVLMHGAGGQIEAAFASTPTSTPGPNGRTSSIPATTTVP
jgi:hypothetical protein